jgi:REP element-mobilizing transposase RayT
MTTGYQVKDQTRAHFLTLQIVAWVDIFTRKVYKDILVDALNYCTQHKGLIIFGYVIMSNHLHIIAQSTNDNLSGIVRDFKSYTSKEMLKATIKGLWQTV